MKKIWKMTKPSHTSPILDLVEASGRKSVKQMRQYITIIIIVSLKYSIVFSRLSSMQSVFPATIAPKIMLKTSPEIWKNKDFLANTHKTPIKKRLSKKYQW